MNEYYMNVNFAKGTIDTNLNKLVQNDYNSTKINFTFDKEGIIQFKMLFPDLTTAYIDEIQNNEIILSEGLLSQNGIYKIEICINGTDSRLTDYPTHEFVVRKELIDTDPIVEPDDRVPILDSLINDVNQAIDNVEGLKDDIDTALEEVNQAIEETNNLDLDVNKVEKEATVEITKKDGTTKEVKIYDGVSLQFMWQGTSLGIKTDDMQDYVFVNLQGVQGVPGPQGEPFRIKKTYPSVEAMNADFNNMNVGDYVMIASTVEVEDNAKLYTRGDYQWIFITDFSGATGIKGETGATPIIHIGTVTSGSTPSVTISGTTENPIFNFVLQPGLQGETGPQGETGATGNGISSITKTSTSGLVDTYTITYTNGTTSTFEITNGKDGEDGEVTQAQLDALQREVDYNAKYSNALIKESATGTSITINDTAECPMPMELVPSETNQDNNLFDDNTVLGYLNYDGTIVSDNSWITSANLIQVDGNKTYLIKGNDMGTRILYIFYNVNQERIGSRAETTADTSFTSPSNAKYMKFSTNNVNATNIIVTGVPTPDNPQDIHTISGNNEIKVENKNLFDENAFTTQLVSGKILNDSGVEVSDNSSTYSTYKIYLKANTTYYLKGAFQRIYYYDENGIFKSRSSASNGVNNSYTPTTNEYIGFQINNTYWTSNKGQEQIEKGSTATSYVSHQEQVLPLNLGDLEYCKIGNYEDEFYLATESDTSLVAGKWYLKKNTSKKTLNGSSSEIWSRQSSSTLTSYFQTNSVVSLATTVSKLPLGYTNYFTKNTGSILGTTDGITGFTFNTSGYFRIRIENTNASTVDQLRTWLSTHNLIVYYPIATPEYVLLNDTLQEQLDNIYKFALSYQDQTNISQVNNDLPFIITATGVKDLNKLINLMLDRITTLEG